MVMIKIIHVDVAWKEVIFIYTHGANDVLWVQLASYNLICKKSMLSD